MENKNKAFTDLEREREMGFYISCFAGGGFLLIGAWEAFISSYAYLNPSSPPLSPPHQTKTTAREQRRNQFFVSVRFISVAFISFFLILNSIISLTDALQSKDQVGFSLQLDVISIASLFFLYSVVGLLSIHTNMLPLPSSIPNLIVLFAFGQEFLIFYVQRKDPTGIENRYFDLLLVPIIVCIFSTLLELGWPKSNLPKLGRGFGLILHGTWFLQMGFSFYTNLMVHGCTLHKKSRGNFTVKCKGHPEYHRSKAIATLQFNCHLAFLVVLIIGVYSFICQKYGFPGDYLNYKPLHAELHQLGNNHVQFSLDSDEDEEIIVEENVTHQKALVIVPESEVNGFGTH